MHRIRFSIFFLFFPTLSQADPWIQVSTHGFGDANNQELTRGTTFFDGSNHYVYFGVKNSTTGAQIWRSSDGFSWNQANTSGFDVMASSNQAVSWLGVFSGAILAGSSSQKIPTGAGARIYRSPTGQNPWSVVFSTQSGLNSNNTGLSGSFEIFQSTFYVGTDNPTTGCEIWRSTAANSIGGWTQVAANGFGAGVANERVAQLKAFSNSLYAATHSSLTSRGQVWRSPDGTTWSQVLVASNTFSANTKSVSALESFGGYFYAGTLNTNGAQLWRTANPVNGPWTQLFSSDGNGSTRFSVTSSSEIHALISANGILYAATWDPGLNTGTRIYRSTDGVRWVTSNLAGFGSPVHQWTGGLVSSGTFLYASTRNDALGGSIWRSSAVIPGQPILAGSALSPSSINWSWASVSHTDGFQVLSSTFGNLSGLLSTATLSWTETNLSTNTAATRYVISFNAVDVSTSLALTRYTLAMPPVSTVFQGVFGSSITLSWNANTNPGGTNYQVRLWQAGGSTTTTTVAATNAALTSLLGATTYFMDVVALNGDNVATTADVTLTTATQLILVAVGTVTAGSAASFSINTPAGIATLTVPERAFASDIYLIFQSTTSIPATVASAAATLQATGVAVQIDESPSVQPNKLISISVPYLAANVAGMDPSKLVLARFDITRSLWVPLESSPDPTNMRVTARTNHLSIFQIMQAIPSSSISSVNIYPNPFRPTLGHQYVTFSNLPASTRLRIYTLNGELVQDLTTSSAGIATWDAKNRSGMSVASGVYFVFLQGNGGKNTSKVVIQR